MNEKGRGNPYATRVQFVPASSKLRFPSSIPCRGREDRRHSMSFWCKYHSFIAVMFEGSKSPPSSLKEKSSQDTTLNPESKFGPRIGSVV